MRLYDPTKPPSQQSKNDATDVTKAIPQGFIDAMTVREEVFVKEQGVPLESEFDEDDPLSFHWVAYASIPVKQTSPELKPQDEKMDGTRRASTSTKIPIGTIRLVPPPHSSHPNGKNETAMHKSNESYVKLGRLAVIKEFRKAGISKLLIETALDWVRKHPYDTLPHLDPMEAMKSDAFGIGMEFRGLVLVHAQTGVQKVWKKYGFETDESMGIWDEEGIDHVGMWKKLDIVDGRRKSKVRLLSSPANDQSVEWASR